MQNLLTPQEVQANSESAAVPEQLTGITEITDSHFYPPSPESELTGYKKCRQYTIRLFLAISAIGFIILCTSLGTLMSIETSNKNYVDIDLVVNGWDVEAVGPIGSDGKDSFIGLLKLSFDENSNKEYCYPLLITASVSHNESDVVDFMQKNYPKDKSISGWWYRTETSDDLFNCYITNPGTDKRQVTKGVEAGFYMFIISGFLAIAVAGCFIAYEIYKHKN